MDIVTTLEKSANASKYATLGFSDKANLDLGSMW